jgi:hypothetical protein
MTALELGPVSQHWIDAGFRGQQATLEWLRVDRQLEEAAPKDPTRCTWRSCSTSMPRPRSTMPGDLDRVRHFGLRRNHGMSSQNQRPLMSLGDPIPPRSANDTLTELSATTLCRES